MCENSFEDRKYDSDQVFVDDNEEETAMMPEI